MTLANFIPVGCRDGQGQVRDARIEVTTKGAGNQASLPVRLSRVHTSQDAIFKDELVLWQDARLRQGKC
jgi:hypothetical protein